ncbi:MAG: fibronectin type III domain-containing protein [Treponema sp.]|nr:fibronectin type III domain-containing protein [Treponema sp.]
MKRNVCLISLLYLFCAGSASLYSVGEKTIQFGADALWKMADYRAGITEVSLIRSAPVLVLSPSRGASSVSGASRSDSTPDLTLSFDEGRPALFRDSAGHYRVIASPLLASVADHNARVGPGAAFFTDVLPELSNAGGAKPEKSTSSGPLVIEAQSRAALFAPHNHIYDFSIEFWLNPLNMENGEQILQWVAARPLNDNKTSYASQRILCVSSKNRLQWSFTNFFTSPDDKKSIEINIGGVSAVVPKTWSHHLIRFDSFTGMVEYLVNGKTETIEYAVADGHEGGEVYTPITGEGGCFILGNGFSGLMDEFRIHGVNAPVPAVRKYPLQGGRIETRALDLGAGSNGVLKLEASGGRIAVRDARLSNEFMRNGRFRFSDDSEMQFFIRSSDNPYRWDGPWRAVTPGAEFAGIVQGRYVQLAVDFYPSANGESSPYLEELCITYLPDEPPLPPSQLTAVALDGAVQLRWKSSPDQNTRGYLVYYGTASDDYFGEDAVLGVSPIDVGKQNTIYIDGLKNGTLYYFRVAAYTNHAGEFSREVRARPLQ